MISRPLRSILLSGAAVALVLLLPGGALAGDDDGLRRVRVHRLAHGPGFHASGAFLGVGFLPLTPELRRHWGVAEEAGVLVSKVVEDSPAAKAGVQVGDILTRIDGDSVERNFALHRLIGRREPGETVTLEVVRGGRAQTLSATLEKHEFERRFAGDGPRHDGHARAFVLECDDDDEDCRLLRHPGLDCEGEEPCEIKIECREGDCTCTVNGKPSACVNLGDED
jgi:membrane-associated protease RseP (regulator of RpoE activity)